MSLFMLRASQLMARGLEADQHRTIAGIVARRRADKIAQQIGVALFPDVPCDEVTDGIGAIVMPLEQRADER
jgi:hypothetical protein